MKFRTEIQPLVPSWHISHRENIFLIGSCFTDTIGKRLHADLFKVMVNHFGTVYNPASIACQIDRIVHSYSFNESDLIHENGLYHSFLAHSSLSSTSKRVALDNLNSVVETTWSFLRNCQVAIITLGTAMVYVDKKSGLTVANCHKLPPERFTNAMMSKDDITENLVNIRSALKSISPEIKIIFTVSPIRYVSYGLHENQLSKAALLLGVDKICREFNEDCLYFPSYEIMLDDLRDYRFYDSDLKHPSEMAADYVYDIFSQSFFSSETRNISGLCRKLTRRFEHKPLTDNQKSHESFINATRIMASRLTETYPFLAETVKSYSTNLLKL